MAKLLSLLTVGILATLILYVVSVVSSAVWFGLDSFQPYVTASGGQAMEINALLYLLADAFVQFIDVFVFMLFAFMLSIITRNTAASVGIAIGVYFGGSMATAMVTQLFRGEWVNFLPFSNLSLSSRFFPYSGVNNMINSMMGVGTAGTGPQPCVFLVLPCRALHLYALYRQGFVLPKGYLMKLLLRRALWGRSFPCVHKPFGGIWYKIKVKEELDERTVAPRISERRLPAPFAAGIAAVGIFSIKRRKDDFK